MEDEDPSDEYKLEHDYEDPDNRNLQLSLGVKDIE